ncbi:MAG TPA: tetratricopeptide repeat protein [Candidatus Saccharimonadia bacterium]|nr:tetratricopeptide repeat protein [Candidatus Saccharimonadia bacterium]
MSFIAELRRRNVIRMAGLYLVGAWLVVQVAGTLLPVFHAPEWVLATLVVLLALGFVPALVFAWVFEMTPEGLKRDAEVAPEQSIAPQTARRMDRMIIGALALALLYFVLDKFVLAPGRDAERGVPAPSTVVPPPAAPEPAAARIDEKSIAVLPFVDMSQGKDQEYFSDGITEEILNALTRIEGLKVAGRTSSFHFKGRNESLGAIGAALGVAHVLEGSVRKQGERIRITAQLVKVSDGFHLWSQNYDRKLDDIFAVQDEISVAIASALSSQLMGVAPGANDAGLIDPKAYDAYLRARRELAQRTGEHILQAAALFESAAKLQPDFAAAFAGRARALSLAWGYLGMRAGDDHGTQAVRAAERALALDPGNAEAHSALGFVYLIHQWRWADGERETARAIELAPNDAEVANFAGDSYRSLGDFDAASRWERRALELDPLFDVNHVDLAWALLAQRRCDEAIAAAEKGIAIDPTYWTGHDALGRSRLCLGDTAGATQHLEALEGLIQQAPFALDLRARIAVREGKREAAHAALAQLQRRAADGETLHYTIASIQALLGDLDAAAVSLERAYETRDPAFVGDDYFMLPEEWPVHPGIRAAHDKPELNALYEIRRRNFARTPRSPLP